MWFLIRLASYFFRSASAWLGAIRSAKWPTAEALVTSDPAPFRAFAGCSVEVSYTYRFQGELYTGLHEEPSFGGVGTKFLRRFAKGRRFLVRVNPAKPDVSIMRDWDQSDDIQERLEQIDEPRDGGVAQR